MTGDTYARADSLVPGQRARIHGDAWCEVTRIDHDAEPGFVHVHVRATSGLDAVEEYPYLPPHGWYRLAPHERAVT